MRHFCFYAFLVLLLVPPALVANDTVAVISAGGLEPIRTSSVRMVSEDLHISLDRVTIVYKFENVTDHDVDALVAFPLPAIDGGLAYHATIDFPSKEPVNFLRFEVRADGHPVRVSTDIKARDGKRDISAHLTKLHVPLSVLDPIYGKKTIALPRTTREKLLKEKLLEGSEGFWWPEWDTYIRFYWRQRFPAGRTIELQQSYQPLVGGWYTDPKDAESSISGPHSKNYCSSNQQVEKAKALPAARLSDGETLIWGRELSYILKTGANWKGPIGEFHLQIETPSDNDVLFSCFEGLSKTGPRSYEFARKNFTPSQDLNLLIVTNKEPKLRTQ